MRRRSSPRQSREHPPTRAVSRGAATPSLAEGSLAGEASRLASLLTALLGSTFRQILWRKATELDLTFSQGQILCHVSRNRGCPMGEVARAFGITLPAVTQLVDRLSQKGLVTRGADRADRRVSTLALTAAGRALVDEFDRLRTEALVAVLGRMPPDERSRALDGLEALVRVATSVTPEESEMEDERAALSRHGARKP